MKNWKKIMAMVCTAAMISGASAPVWAADDTETAAEEAEVTEYTYDMLEKEAYEGTWLSFEPGFDLYVPSDWEVLEVSEEDQKALELGRQLLNQKAEEAEKNRKRSKKWKARTKQMAAVAAVLVCVFGVSVRSEAGRAYFMKMWNFVSGNELSIKINKTGTGDVIRSLSEAEERMNH